MASDSISTTTLDVMHSLAYSLISGSAIVTIVIEAPLLNFVLKATSTFNLFHS